MNKTDKTYEIEIGGKAFTFAVRFVPDHDTGAPWENEEGHGPVSDWTTRSKLPGELVLYKDRSMYRYYDFAEACRIALRNGWYARPCNDGSETKRQLAAKAAREDYERLRQWCNNDWCYVGVIVTLLGDDGEETEVSDSLWGVATWDNWHHEQARLLVVELASGYGTRWTEAERSTYAWFE